MSTYHEYLMVLEDVLSKEHYLPLLQHLRKRFNKEYATITELDRDTRELTEFYFETILTMRLPNSGDTLLSLLYINNEIPREIEYFFQNRTHSLFLVKKIGRSGLVLRDLFQPKNKISLPPEEYFLFQKGAIIQGFLYNNKFLSPTAIVHPMETCRYLLKEYKKAECQPSFLQRAFRNYLSASRYQKKSPLTVYQMNL